MLLIFIFLLLVLCYGVSQYALRRYEEMPRRGGAEPGPLAHTGAEMAEIFLREEGVGDVRVVEHDSVVSDYFDAGRRCLFLRPRTAQGTTLAAWAVALHEAAHATQTGDAKADLKWRRTVIGLNRYGPGIGVFASAALLLVLRSQFRLALVAFVALCVVLLLLNLGTLAVEFNANARLRRFLEQHLARWPDAQDRLRNCLSAVATREVGDMLRSHRYFLFSALPGTGKLRPDGTEGERRPRERDAGK